MPKLNIKTITLKRGPTKRVWVNKRALPQFGGTDPNAEVWYVECEGRRYEGWRVAIQGFALCRFIPSEGDGPHAWVETFSKVLIYTKAAEEAA